MNLRLQTIGLITLAVTASPLHASEAEIIDVQFTRTGKTWTVRTMLQHGDTGWDHYADAWRVVDSDDNVLATRVITRPHVEDQPFARSLRNVNIPRQTHIVFIEAHDTGSGWSKRRVKVDLKRKDGPRYRVSR